MSQIGNPASTTLTNANFANSPSPSVSLTAVPGTAITAKRSDEVLALDQTAPYVFSALGATTIAPASNAVNPLTVNSATGFVGNYFDYQLAGSSQLKMTVTSTRGVSLTSGAASSIMSGQNTSGAAGAFYALSRLGVGANSGVSTLIEISGSGVANSLTLNSTQILGWTSSTLDSATSGTFRNNLDTILTRAAAATLQLGAANADTTGVNQTLQAQGVTTGGTNNQAGGNLTIASGQGKGNVASSLIFQTPAVGGSGNTLQTMTTALTLGPSTLATFAGNVDIQGSIATANLNFNGHNLSNVDTVFGSNGAGANLTLATNNSTGAIVLKNNSASFSSSIFIPANAAIQFGATNAASPIAQTLQVQNGSGTNIAAAATFTVIAPLGTGTGNNGDYVIKTGTKVGSGTGVATQNTALTIKGETQRTVASAPIGFAGYTVATLPAGITGDNAYVTDALAPTFLATVVGGGAIITPVFYNGTNWIGA